VKFPKMGLKVHNVPKGYFLPLRCIYPMKCSDSDYTGLSFTVSDGRHMSGLHWLAVYLIEPESLLRTNTKLVLAPGSSCPITRDHLSLDQNITMNADGIFSDADQVVFQISEPPRYGVLSIGGVQVSNFSQDDLDGNRLTFDQNRPLAGLWMVKDGFTFRLGEIIYCATII